MIKDNPQNVSRMLLITKSRLYCIGHFGVSIGMKLPPLFRGGRDSHFLKNIVTLSLLIAFIDTFT